MNGIEILHALDSIPEDDRPNAIKEGEKLIYQNSLALTAQDLLGYKDINPRTHKDVIKVLESRSTRKLIVLPRGCFKSSLGSVAFPIWLLISNPNLRVMLDSELYTNSKNLLREIKMHLMSERIVELFGSFKHDSCWNESEIIVNQRTSILKEASVTASGLGAEKTGQHYDVIICDDLNSPNNSGTQEGRDKVIQHYRYNTSILEPNGTMVVIGTRFSEDDLPGFILSQIIGDEE